MKVCIILLIAGSALAQPSGYDIDTTWIGDQEYRYVRDEVLIKLMPGVDVSSIGIELNAEILDSIPEIGWYRLQLPSNQDAVPVWQNLDSDSRIRFCELHLILSMGTEDDSNGGDDGKRNCPPPQEIQWPITITKADQAWNQVPVNNDILIAILDTGIDQDHYENPAGEFYGSEGKIEVGRDWYDYYGGKDWQPAWDHDYSLGHGTHRVGEIAAPYGNGGIAGIIAGWGGPNNQKCRVLVEKVAETKNDLSYWAVPAALSYAVFTRGARVVSCSIYGLSGTDPYGHFMLWRDQFFAVEAHQLTTILCCTGNKREHNPYISYPAAWSCSLNCVVAVNSSTHEDEIWSQGEYRQGSYGGHDYTGEVSILGPGGDSNQSYSYCATGINGAYNTKAGGTSGATAHAAGITALVLCKYPGLIHEQVKNALQNGAFRIDVSECDWHVDDVDCWSHLCWCHQAGSGRIDALRSLKPWLMPRCGSRIMGEMKPPDVHSFGNNNRCRVSQISIYDLLGRRLCTYSIQDRPFSKESAVSYIRNRNGSLPIGAKFVRVINESEVITWRIIP